jgi:predicted  nucleic acid-binding Zn-ribbon protein
MVIDPAIKLQSEIDENNTRMRELTEQLEQLSQARDYSAMTDVMTRLQQLVSGNKKKLKKLASGKFGNPLGLASIFYTGDY